MWRHGPFLTRLLILSINAIGTASISCPQSFTKSESGSACYIALPYARTYADAVAGCNEVSASLPVLRNYMDLMELRNAVDPKHNLNIWIAANDKAFEGKWVVEKGASCEAPWQDWLIGEPKDHESADCAMITKKDKWMDVICSGEGAAKAQAVCQIKSFDGCSGGLPAAFAQGSESCPSGYVPARDGLVCYKLIDTYTFNYRQARDMCKRDNDGVMPLFRDHEDIDYMRAALGTFPEKGIWLPLKDDIAEGTYMWTAENVCPYPYQPEWAPYQPDNFLMLEDCGEMNIEGKMNDVNCLAKYAAVCQIRLYEKPKCPNGREYVCDGARMTLDKDCVDPALYRVDGSGTTVRAIIVLTTVAAVLAMFL